MWHVLIKQGFLLHKPEIRVRTGKLKIRLRSAHATVVGDGPVVRSDSLGGVEDVTSVPLVLDGRQLGVVLTEELGLVVWLLEIGFVHVGAHSWGDSLDLWHDDIGHLVLESDHIGPWGGEAPVGGDGGVDEGLSPGWEDGVLVGSGLS